MECTEYSSGHGASAEIGQAQKRLVRVWARASYWQGPKWDVDG